MAEERFKRPAEMCSYIDEKRGTLHIELSIPGVPREKIHLQMQEDSFNLAASRDDFDYVSTAAFCCPVKAEEARAEYRDGLLHVTVPFKDTVEQALEIAVQ
jgi:HSP20 family molecular chaperone IbpA